MNDDQSSHDPKAGESSNPAPGGSGRRTRDRSRQRSRRRGGGQAAAINRSRPIYDTPPARRSRSNRYSRNGGPASGQSGFRGGRSARSWGRGDAAGGRPTGERSQRGGSANRNRARKGAPRVYDRDRISRGGSGDSRTDYQTDSEGRQRSAAPLPSNPREAALRVLHAVDTRNAFSDRLLDGAESESSAPRSEEAKRDRALLHELVNGTLRWRGRLDDVLDRLVHIGIGQVQPWVKNILRMGAYQILFLDRVPVHAAVDESVKLAHRYGHPGTAGLVNSVLRRLVEEKDTMGPPSGDDPLSLAAWGSHPLWLVERWCERFGVEETRALLLADNRASRVGLRVNRLRASREQLIERLVGDGVVAVAATLSPELVWIEGADSPTALAPFRDGWCTVQDESEALVSHLVAPKPHERILDLCAAPGGKSTHLAELMGDEGEVWAMERAIQRIRSLEQTVQRVGAHSVHVVHGDGRNYAFPMPFDRVLVDAPCSGLGVLGRRADARWRKGPEVLGQMPPLQLELLTSAGRHARPGGVLVYSVCSFEPEETTSVVERFLRQSPSFVLESAAGLVPDAVVDDHGFMRVLPHLHGCDGAFAARFRRI